MILLAKLLFLGGSRTLLERARKLSVVQIITPVEYRLLLLSL